MNRRFLAAALLCAGAAVPCSAATILPGIEGTVFSGGMEAAIPGVTVQLFQDDGDGTFDPGSDAQIGPDVLTDASGSYCFDELDIQADYFVYRPAQPIEGTNIGADVSDLLSPGVPLQIIDSFENHQVVRANPTTPAATSAVNSATSLVGERDLFVELMSGIGEVSLRSNAFGVDVLQYDTTPGVMGHGIVTWDGVDVSASKTPSLELGNVDLTDDGQATGLLLKLGVDRTGTGDQLRFRFFRDSVTEFSEAAIEIPVTGGKASEIRFLPFDDFTGPVTPNNVNAIQMSLGDGAKSIDAQIDWIGTGGPTTHDFVVIPEPTGASLTILGLLLLGSCRRRYT